MHAEDADIGKNAVIKYGMYSDILSSDTSEGLENINDLPFLLDPETGDISLNFDPQKGILNLHISIGCQTHKVGTLSGKYYSY